MIRGGWKLCCSLAVSGRIQWNFALTTGCGRALGMEGGNWEDWTGRKGTGLGLHQHGNFLPMVDLDRVN